MPFLFEKKEHNKDAHKYIEITGFVGTAGDLVVPAKIDGLPVETIGNHSFSGRQDLKSVTLPETIKTLYGFAFHNCRNLKKISLFDSIDDYYDGVCRQCDSLSEINITINRSWFEVIRNFLADNDRTLHFTVRVSQEDDSRENENLKPGSIAGSASYVTSSLTFPEYVYDFNENTMARTIQFSIAGSGMFYRECVDRRSINYREYDKLFEKAKIDGGSISEDIAVGRLLYPVELDDRYRLMYEEYVAGSGLSILKRYIEGAKDDPASAVNMIRELLRYSGEKELFSRGDIDEAISCSVELGLTEVTAILMESGSGAGSEKSAAMRFEF
ncbi:MAG: leucine-rich repeat protein [Butyrivibrio sp.]|nr:leucine-rich repeat domain-containing protein [Butyrivibrio sp.]MBQ8030250.1 leucine-rich repeat protein [Butyrivibrio sp.]MBR1642120.1 leucine-rich repeat protein [Butyrivibrio sp.]